MVRKYLIVGNWKMNKTPNESENLSNCILNDIATKSSNVEIAICPPFTSLDRCSNLLRGSAVMLGAQNLYHNENGAFTGEIAPGMLVELGVKYVIIGHSERRAIFHETDIDVNKKALIAQKHNLIPIICVGESIDERENNKTLSVIENQVSNAIAGLSENFVIAYEPIWAIGTGKTATPAMAQEVHKFIREMLRKNFNELADGIHILYGGSMKPENAQELLSQDDITGGLIGGASLNSKDFSKIIDVVK